MSKRRKWATRTHFKSSLLSLVRTRTAHAHSAEKKLPRKKLLFLTRAHKHTLRGEGAFTAKSFPLLWFKGSFGNAHQVGLIGVRLVAVAFMLAEKQPPKPKDDAEGPYRRRSAADRGTTVSQLQ